MPVEWRVLALLLRSVAQLLDAVPDGDPLRRTRVWQQVEQQFRFLTHLLEDISREVRRDGQS